MPLSPAAAQKALIAFNRFGLGAKPGGSDRIGADPLGALRREVGNAGIALIRNATLPTYAQACRAATGTSTETNAVRDRELSARVGKHVLPEIGFVERLVIFWSNHFSLSRQKGQFIRGMVGQFERDVIRKHVLGQFSDMLIGAIRHPAMVFFLDNQGSRGPNSPKGGRPGTGYNENLAREVLELYTVGSGSGYSQADVTAFAKVLTGWSFVRPFEAEMRIDGGTEQNRGQFIFRPEWHEPGPFAVLGKTYPAEGRKQAEKVLFDLARKTATAEHIAYKLVRHFITDKPTPTMVTPLKNVFLRTGGDLKAVSLALLALPEAWSLPLRKIRTPYELSLAQFRALGTRYKANENWEFQRQLFALHQEVWDCPSVEGYSDDTYTWLNADGMRIRVETALYAAKVLGERFSGKIPVLADKIFDRALSKASRQTIAASFNPAIQLATLFACPEFQRR